MGKLDNNSLVIVGDGEMRNALMKKAKKMHKADNIIFLGAMENPLPILKKLNYWYCLPFQKLILQFY